MPLIQISTYPEIIRVQKELFAKIAIANAAVEILKGKLQYVMIMAKIKEKNTVKIGIIQENSQVKNKF